MTELETLRRTQTRGIKMKIRPTLTARCFDKKGRLLSTAKNDYKKSHPIQKHFAMMVGHDAKIYLHAEILAIIRAGDKQIYKIVITRFSPRTNKALNAKPCPICQAAIKAYGIELVSYTTETYRNLDSISQKGEHETLINSHSSSNPHRM